MRQLDDWARRSPGTALLALAILGGTASPCAAQQDRPNLLFIILDDVGIDQLGIFNPQHPDPPSTPTIDAIAAQGVAFNRFTTMPECSPSRVAFFTGRYPLRTGVDAAIFEADLPRAQISPDELTLPRLLRGAGYVSALLGKYHLGGPHNNPDRYRAPAAVGFDYFNGLLEGVPPSIDRSLGGQIDDPSRYPYGFPTGSTRGVGWFRGDGVAIEADDNEGTGWLGLEILERGGIPALDLAGEFATTLAAASAGAAARGGPPDFSRFNAYYVWPRVVNDAGAVRRTIARTYMTVDQTDVSVAWIKEQRRRQRREDLRWMATVSYNSIHTPYQHPPLGLVSGELPEDDGPLAQRLVSKRMLEAMDQEIGRLLVESGLARRDDFGALVYDPAATDTMIVIAGDNGTQFQSVRFPYSPLRSKGTAYQTGVLAPLVVAGPLVDAPGREVNELVNAVDLFQLFGELGGLDVRASVPASHVLDSRSMLHHLTGTTGSAREYSFAQVGPGAKPATDPPSPCVLHIAGISTCNGTLMTTRGLCEDNGGTWYGDGAPVEYATCCEVEDAGLADVSQGVAASSIQNQRYKLVRIEPAVCKALPPVYELYDLFLHPQTLLDDPPNLLELPALTPTDQENLAELQAALAQTLASQPACPGDGNLDGVVDEQDLLGVRRYRGRPSRFDFDDDGTTGPSDRAIVRANLGNSCPGTASAGGQ